MVNSKKKGNIWENKLANWLRDNSIKAWKDGASGGGNREKGDVGNNIDCTIESKAAKNIKLMEWWKQVTKSASLHRNKPILFIHQDGMAKDPPEWLVVMHSEDWVELVKGNADIETDFVDPQKERNKKYNIEALIRVAKNVLKDYE